jgi:tetratricopeptide (TPR) repeat protein
VRLASLLAAAISITLPAAALSQSDVEFKTTNQRAISEFKLAINNAQYNSADEASSHLAAALRADPNFGLARVFWALYAALPPTQRDSEMKRGLADAAHGSDNELILGLAAREAVLGHINVASALFRAVSLLRPSDRMAELLSTLDLTGNEALVAHRALISRHPEYAFGYNTLAFDLWFTGDHAGALAAARKQIEFDSTVSNPHDSYAHLLQWNGEFEPAKTQYLQAVKSRNPYVASYGGLAEIAALHGQYDQARSYLDQAIAASYTPAEKLGYMKQVAGTYALEGVHTDLLIKQLEQIAAAAKEQGRMDLAAETYGQLAAMHSGAGHTEIAHKLIATSTSVAPSDAWWHHYYASVAHAQMKHWGPAQAEVAALRSMQAAHANVSADQIAAAEGFLLTEQGKPDQALKVLMTADTATSFIVINRIAEAHGALGHGAEAAAWNKRITDNYNLSLADFPGVNARRRAREEAAAAGH